MSRRYMDVEIDRIPGSGMWRGWILGRGKHGTATVRADTLAGLKALIREELSK
jgi:hypothetical protein